ncbi:MAG: glycosyltransferase [Planctomycetes bacterium]|nr:glycosyltransferase [Planctomycetota bacterium]
MEEFQTSEERPLISVVIPARDEERNLPACIDAIEASAALLGEPVEILVVLDRCTDGTEAIATGRGARVIHRDAQNLSLLRNEGVRHSRGRYVCTVDADSRMSKGVLPEVARRLGGGGVIGGGILILPERWSLGILLTGALIMVLLLARGLSCGLFWFRREDFDAMGGFDESRLSAEDIDFALRLKRYGKTKKKSFSMLRGAHIVTSCRKFDRFGDWYFLRHPFLAFSLLKGRNREGANRLWYSFSRDCEKNHNGGA